MKLEVRCLLPSHVCIIDTKYYSMKDCNSVPPDYGFVIQSRTKHLDESTLDTANRKTRLHLRLFPLLSFRMGLEVVYGLPPEVHQVTERYVRFLVRVGAS